MTLEKGPLNTEKSVMCLGYHQATEDNMRVIVPVALLSLFSFTLQCKIGTRLPKDCCDQVELNVTGEADGFLKHSHTDYAGVYTITDDPEQVKQVNGRPLCTTSPPLSPAVGYIIPIWN